MKKRPLILAFAAGAALLAAGAASANNVQWSIGINLPPIATVVSNAPVYGPAPAPVYTPAPVYRPAPVYQPAPVYYPAPVYQPAPVYYPAPVYESAPAYYPPQVVYRAPAVVVPSHGWGHRGPPAYHHGGPHHARPVVIVEPRREGWRHDGRWSPDHDGRGRHHWPQR